MAAAVKVSLLINAVVDGARRVMLCGECTSDMNADRERLMDEWRA
ncbi:MAG: hypothetical protein ACXQS6_05910 [Candidatus Syntropharchaeales archaeon]